MPFDQFWVGQFKAIPDSKGFLQVQRLRSIRVLRQYPGIINFARLAHRSSIGHQYTVNKMLNHPFGYKIFHAAAVLINFSFQNQHQLSKKVHFPHLKRSPLRAFYRPTRLNPQLSIHTYFWLIFIPCPKLTDFNNPLMFF